MFIQYRKNPAQTNNRSVLQATVGSWTIEKTTSAYYLSLDKQDVGVCIFNRKTNTAGIEIVYMHVLPHLQGQGLGSLLLTSLYAHQLRQNESGPLVLTLESVLPDHVDDNSLLFWMRHGFTAPKFVFGSVWLQAKIFHNSKFDHFVVDSDIRQPDRLTEIARSIYGSKASNVDRVRLDITDMFAQPTNVTISGGTGYHHISSPYPIYPLVNYIDNRNFVEPSCSNCWTNDLDVVLLEAKDIVQEDDIDLEDTIFWKHAFHLLRSSLQEYVLHHAATDSALRHTLFSNMLLYAANYTQNVYERVVNGALPGIEIGVTNLLLGCLLADQDHMCALILHDLPRIQRASDASHSYITSFVTDLIDVGWRFPILPLKKWWNNSIYLPGYKRLCQSLHKVEDEKLFDFLRNQESLLETIATSFQPKHTSIGRFFKLLPRLGEVQVRRAMRHYISDMNLTELQRGLKRLSSQTIESLVIEKFLSIQSGAIKDYFIKTDLDSVVRAFVRIPGPSLKNHDEILMVLSSYINIHEAVTNLFKDLVKQDLKYLSSRLTTYLKSNLSDFTDLLLFNQMSSAEDIRLVTMEELVDTFESMSEQNQEQLVDLIRLDFDDLKDDVQEFILAEYNTFSFPEALRNVVAEI